MIAAVRDTVRLLLRPEWHRARGPATVRTGKVAADDTEPVTVFLFGIRINRWSAVRRWFPLVLTVGTMLRELVADPGSGLLGYRLLFGPGLRQAMIVQYWRDTDDLFGFARRFEGRHRSAQRRYFRHYGATEAVGVWHEVLPIHAGEYHGIYGNMPPVGMGALRPVRGREWWVRAAFTYEGQENQKWRGR